MRITRAQLLSPDRATVVLTHGQVARALFEPLAFSESYPEAPALTARVDGPDRAAWDLGRVLRLEYDDDGAGGGPTVEAWRVRDAGQSYTSADSGTVELEPFWMELGSRTIVAEIEGTSVATPRLALVSRTPASALGVAFDPLNGAPAVLSGAPLFIAGHIDARYADERVDVSIVGGSPLDVVEAVAADLRCLWRARLVLSGDGPADEVYEVDLYAPAEPPDVPADAFTPSTSGKIDADTLAEIGNASGMKRANVADLSIERSTSGLVTALVPLAQSQSEDPVGIGLHVFAATAVSPLTNGQRTVTLGGRRGEPALVVPFDGALVGTLLCRLNDDDAEQAWPVVASTAPDQVTITATPGGNTQFFGIHRFMRPGTGVDAPRRAMVQLVNTASAAVYGVRSEARTYDDIAPYANEFVNGRCDLAGAGEDALPLDFVQLAPSAPVTWAWTDAEASVSLGARSAQFTAAAAGSGVYATTDPLSAASTSRARAAWTSLRVISGTVEVSVPSNGSTSPGTSQVSVLVSADTSTSTGGTTNVGGLVLTTVEVFADDFGPGTFDVTYKAVGGPATWVVDGLTVVQSATPQPYQTLSGPEALWARAWDDLLLAPRRVTTASTTSFDPAALGLPPEDLSPGAWVRVRPDGRAPVELQVLEARWELDLAAEGTPGGVAAERQMRLGPPPVDLVSRLSSPPDRARAPEGSKRARPYALWDRGPSASGSGRTVEPASEGLVSTIVLTRTLLGVSYDVPAARMSAYGLPLMRRDPARPDDRALHLTSPPD